MSPHKRPTKILFAVGGTGGHLFPAQALARELKEHNLELEILFAGGQLGSNQFFHKLQFPFREVASASPFYSNPAKSIFKIARGIRESRELMKEFFPDLIIGFGSFYSFPLLVMARIRKIPYILVEANAYPGKVNRLFSSRALFSAIQFKKAAEHIKGKTAQTKMPFWSHELNTAYLHPAEARKYFQLDPECFTLLVFGGSQGARVINEAVVEMHLNFPFQVIHLCGRDQDHKILAKRYQDRKILACVKPFEERMHIAWRAADLAICRAGAGTLVEMGAFEVPAILIPWPGATDQHQEKNAEAMVKVGGAILLNQGQMRLLEEKVSFAKSQLPQMRESLKLHMQREAEELSQTVVDVLSQLGKDYSMC